MSERPGDDDELDPSDWLAAQFGQSGEAKKPAEPTPEPEPPATVPPAVVPPAPAPPAPTAPPATDAPGGFSWGLRGGDPTATTPPAPAAPVPPPLVEPPASVPPPLVEPAPTVAWTPPPAEQTPTVAWTPPPTEQPTPAEPPPTVAWTPPPAEPTPTEPPSWDQPTQAMPAVAEPKPDPYAGVGAAELLGAAALASEPGATTGLDALFGDEQFRDYEAEPAPSESPFAKREAGKSGHAAISSSRITGTQKVLLAVAGGLVALLALAALFLLGTRLPAILGPAPAVAPSASPSPTPSPTPTVDPIGPVEPGVWAWDELLGGECLDPYADPWAEEFTVVDCANPHPAQMVVRGTFPASAEGVTDDPYPGAEALQGQLSLLCTAPGVLDLAVAGQYPDVQFQGTYPANAEQWDAGDRHYYCFVSRSSGEPLTGSVAVAPAPPAA